MLLCLKAADVIPRRYQHRELQSYTMYGLTSTTTLPKDFTMGFLEVGSGALFQSGMEKFVPVLGSASHTLKEACSR